MILALAATSLNLVLGFGGMVAFGDAGIGGLGAYTVGILMEHAVISASLAWPAAMLVRGGWRKTCSRAAATSLPIGRPPSQAYAFTLTTSRGPCAQELRST